jgi:hypothetical protein
MSVYFKSGESVLWNPTLTVGLLYHDAVSSAASTFEMDAGLGALQADEADLDLERFRSFIGALVDIYIRSTHPVLRVQLPPVILPGIVMLERGGQALVADNPETSLILQAASHLGQSMST